MSELVKSNVPATQGFAYRITYKTAEMATDEQSTITVVTTTETGLDARMMAQAQLGEDIVICKVELLSRVAVQQPAQKHKTLYKHQQEEDTAHDPIFDSFGKRLEGQGYYETGTHIIGVESLDDFMLEIVGATYSKARNWSDLL